MSPLRCLLFTAIGLRPSSDLSFHKETEEHVKMKKDSVLLNLCIFDPRILKSLVTNPRGTLGQREGRIPVEHQDLCTAVLESTVTSKESNNNSGS